MVIETISLASFSLVGMLNDWQAMGVFDYALPFLLIFALIYAILEKSDILGPNVGVRVIIALSAGLLSLVGGFVPRFFAQIFPNLGIALSVLLVAIVLLGLFMGMGKEEGIGPTVKWIIVGTGIIGIIFAVYYAFNGYGIYSNVWNNYGNAIITLLIITAIILIIVFGHSKGSGKP